mmetsp:Transcript_28290/g.42845  ORF Transcript_28290/g.42845 Transcript_28290/m.42845 type:complete len:140 (+) Transcript_28290:161-580(+)
MRRDMAVRKLKRAKKGFLSLIRSFDKFGQPIALNYQGEETYKTMGGSCLTILMLLMLLSSVMKSLGNLFENREWTERTNVEILDRQQLEQGISFLDFPTFRAGFEIKPRETSAIRSRERYLELAGLISELFVVDEIGYV